MIQISLCMIAKNEADVIARCLNCVKDIVDEIIVVDTGSTDDTKRICRECGAVVYDFPWVDDFAAARNFSFSKASRDYVMWLDADDILLESDRQKLAHLKETLDPAVDMVMMKYHVAFDAQEQPTFSYYRERLVKRSGNYLWQGPIHEVITPRGNILHADVAVCHRKLRCADPDRNLRIFQKMIREGKALDPRQQFYYARELQDHAKYEEAILVYTKFLDGGLGWIENCIGACKNLADCYFALREESLAVQSLLRALMYDAPRAEICCDLGKYFFGKQRYDVAIFWYKQACAQKIDLQSGGFQQPDCYDYIPYLQLCLCYDRLGDHAQAELFNDKAAVVKPQDPAVLYNKKYFASLKSPN